MEPTWAAIQKHFDILLAAYIANTGKLISDTNAMELVEWVFDKAQEEKRRNEENHLH